MINKNGYTIVEILLCIGMVIIVFGGAYTLYQKAEGDLIRQVKSNDNILNKSKAYLTINEIMLSGGIVEELNENTIGIGDYRIKAVGNSLYVNDKVVLENTEEVRTRVRGNSIEIDVGEDLWYFSSLSN